MADPFDDLLGVTNDGSTTDFSSDFSDDDFSSFNLPSPERAAPTGGFGTRRAVPGRHVSQMKPPHVSSYEVHAPRVGPFSKRQVYRHRAMPPTGHRLSSLPAPRYPSFADDLEGVLTVQRLEPQAPDRGRGPFLSHETLSSLGDADSHGLGLSSRINGLSSASHESFSSAISDQQAQRQRQQQQRRREQEREQEQANVHHGHSLQLIDDMDVHHRSVLSSDRFSPVHLQPDYRTRSHHHQMHSVHPQLLQEQQLMQHKLAHSPTGAMPTPGNVVGPPSGTAAPSRKPRSRASSKGSSRSSSRSSSRGSSRPSSRGSSAGKSSSRGQASVRGPRTTTAKSSPKFATRASAKQKAAPKFSSSPANAALGQTLLADLEAASAVIAKKGKNGSTAAERRLKHNATERYRTYLISEKVAELSHFMKSAKREFKSEKLHILGEAVNFFEELLGQSASKKFKSDPTPQQSGQQKPAPGSTGNGVASTPVTVRQVLTQFPVPVAIVDASGSVVWTNNLFVSMFAWRDGALKSEDKLPAQSRQISEISQPNSAKFWRNTLDKARKCQTQSLRSNVQDPPFFVSIRDIAYVSQQRCVVFEARVTPFTTHNPDASTPLFQVVFVRAAVRGRDAISKKQLPMWCQGCQLPSVGVNALAGDKKTNAGAVSSQLDDFFFAETSPSPKHDATSP